MTGHNCPTCGCVRRSARTAARSPFKRVPPPTYKGGWPASGYVPLDAPARMLAVHTKDWDVSGMVIVQPRDERATINGVEVPNEKLGVTL